MFELTEQQRRELGAAEPLAVDPETKQAYVLVRKENYDRLKSLLAMDDYDPDEGAAYMNEVMADDDAKDPLLESYQLRAKSMNRGDVVVVPFPFQDKPGEKVRPGVVVQSDAENRRLLNTVLVMITGNLDDVGQTTTVFVDPSSPDGGGSGLAGPSLTKCYNLATVRQRRVLHVIGHLSPALMVQVDVAMKAALDLT